MAATRRWGRNISLAGKGRRNTVFLRRLRVFDWRLWWPGRRRRPGSRGRWDSARRFRARVFASIRNRWRNSKPRPSRRRRRVSWWCRFMVVRYI